MADAGTDAYRRPSGTDRLSGNAKCELLPEEMPGGMCPYKTTKSETYDTKRHLGWYVQYADLGGPKWPRIRLRQRKPLTGGALQIVSESRSCQDSELKSNGALGFYCAGPGGRLCHQGHY